MEGWGRGGRGGSEMRGRIVGVSFWCPSWQFTSMNTQHTTESKVPTPVSSENSFGARRCLVLEGSTVLTSTHTSSLPRVWFRSRGTVPESWRSTSASCRGRRRGSPPRTGDCGSVMGTLTDKVCNCVGECVVYVSVSVWCECLVCSHAKRDANVL